MNELLKSGNLIKWKLEIINDRQSTQESSSFQIQNSKCIFLFHSGYNAGRKEAQPLSLSIIFDDKEKLNLPLDITVRVILPFKTFSLPRQAITGELRQMIWSSFDYGLRGSLVTFEMTIHDSGMKEDKCLQMSSYIDACVLLDDLSKDFGNLFLEGPDHDVEFICGDETIRAHKIILCSRSKVFSSMLHTDMKEGKTGQIKIIDVQSDIFRLFLMSLYTGTLSELNLDNAFSLYEVADKYAMNSLKKQCADFLMDNVSPENAFEILLLADRHSDLDLKNYVVDYIVKIETPILGDRWKDFCKSNPVLANDVLNMYCQFLRNKVNILQNQ